MADAAVTFLLGNLTHLMLDQINLISDAENELKLLTQDLEIMKAFLIDVSKRRKNEGIFKEWERQIREVVYEVEDIIDHCITQEAAGVGKNIRNTIFGRRKVHKLALEIKSLREGRVKPVFEKARADFMNLQIADEFDTNQEQQIRVQRNKAPRQDNVVGFEDEMEKLIGYINEESEELEVIPIIGMPGLGKTTIAWKIYQDPRIQYEFPTLIWIYVSQGFNKKDVLLTILKKFTQEDLSSNSVDELAARVTRYLKIGKCLIFMDDVWTVEVWNEIKSFLPKHNKKCKVLITSSDEKVASSANRSRPPHRLRFLDAAESWMLLQIEVFGRLDGVPSELETVGNIIARQCGGLPLAIIAIGVVLVERFSRTVENMMIMKREWEEVSQSVGTYLINAERWKLIEGIISLSYTELPRDLKYCFLYLGVFPEDTEILARTLTHLWIAEGFIQQKQGKSLEEVAQDNLKDLINKNLVMVDKTKLDGEVKTCRVHNTVREFCKNEAGFEEQNFFQEVKKNKDDLLDPPVHVTHKFRRICIHSYVMDFFLGKPKVPRARSFLCFSKTPITLETKDISFITDAFELLRIFDVAIKFPKFPINLLKLVHLRYLTLSCDELRVLPDAISKLWNLQTLTVHTLSRTLEFRANIWKMIQLRHLKTKASIILLKRMDSGRGQEGENLQTLSRLSPQSCTENVFNKTKNLNTLGICGQLATLWDSNCLEKLERLEKLKLVNDVFPRVAHENPLPGLPRKFPPRVRVLTLSTTYLSWTQMSTVGQLSTLEVLKLKDNAFVGDFWEAIGPGFRALKCLYIERTKLMSWTTTDDPFPKLRSLVLKDCEILKGVPFDLGENLEVLSLERVNNYLVVSANKIKQRAMDKKRGFKLILGPMAY